MTCVVPLRERRSKGADVERSVVYARTCTEGPVFNGAQVIWSSGHELVGREESELALGASRGVQSSEAGHPPLGY
jgi:hypothetical protein